jgi:hypothetical protein
MEKIALDVLMNSYLNGKIEKVAHEKTAIDSLAKAQSLLVKANDDEHADMISEILNSYAEDI